ncbi:Filamentation induced by cAMP/death on curing-related protein [Metarhizium brunneum]
MNPLSASLGNAFVKGWPSWHRLRLGNNLRDEEAKLQLPVDMATIMAEAHKKSQSSGIAAFAGAWVEKSLITLIYGSNVIETAGSTLGITTRLCQDIFSGKPVDAYIDKQDPAYREHVESLAETHRKSDMANVVRSRREVIGHANALRFMIDHVILNNEAWSEELILQTHRILYEGIDDDVVPGKYRTHEVAVCYSSPGDKKKKKKKKKTSLCMRAAAVPRYMTAMVEHLNHDIMQAEASGQRDPYTLAARYHHQFVMIHPFGDGNGRMSRIILYTLLLKYAGHVAPFGGGNDKDDYLAIVRRAGVVFHREDMEVDFGQQTCQFEFAKFALAKSKPGLEQMWAWASAEPEDEFLFRAVDRQVDGGCCCTSERHRTL